MYCGIDPKKKKLSTQILIKMWQILCMWHCLKKGYRERERERESDTLVWALSTISLLSKIQYRFSPGGGLGGPTTSFSSSSTESNHHGWVSERWESGFGRGRKRRKLICLVSSSGGATSGAVDGFERGLGLCLLWIMDHGPARSIRTDFTFSIVSLAQPNTQCFLSI